LPFGSEGFGNMGMGMDMGNMGMGMGAGTTGMGEHVGGYKTHGY
jgi:hypothetical protein